MIIPYIVALAFTVFLYGLVINYIWNVIRKHQKVIHSEKFSSKKKLSMLYNLIIRSGDIRIMSFILILISLVSIVSFGILGSVIYNDEIPEFFLTLSVSVSSFFIGLNGYIQYFREEAPSKNYEIEKGPFAKFGGAVLLIIFWGTAIISLIYGFIIWPD